jgi:hypothetical protein
MRIYDVSNYFYGNDETKFSKKLHVVPDGDVCLIATALIRQRSSAE